MSIDYMLPPGCYDSDLPGAEEGKIDDFFSETEKEVMDGDWDESVIDWIAGSLDEDAMKFLRKMYIETSEFHDEVYSIIDNVGMQDR